MSSQPPRAVQPGVRVALSRLPMLWALAAGAGGSAVPDAPPPGSVVLERPQDRQGPPPRPAAAGARGRAWRIPTGLLSSTQVNVDAAGNNTGGDAGNEPSIAVDPTAPNRLAIGWRQFDTIASNFRQAGYSYSRDGGRTWAARQVIEPGLFRSDPVLRAAPDGTFHYLSLRVQQGQFWCDVFSSSDGGATWPVSSYAFGGDKSWLTIDMTGGIGSGNLYQAWNTAGNQFYPAQFNRSTDGSFTWEDPIEYDPDGSPPAQPVFGNMDVGPDGSVYVAGADNASVSDTFWVVRSTNAQNRATVPAFDQVALVDMGGDLLVGAGPSSPNPSGLMGQVNVSVDRSGGPLHGNVYVLCSIDPPGPDPMDVHFIRSEDGGVRWTDPIRVNAEASGWQWFGTMSVSPGGRIDVVWNDTSESGLANVCQLFYASSEDGGVSWTPGVALGPQFDSHVGWPNQNKLGDYYDMHSDRVGASLAYAATYNGEQDVWFHRIGDWDCNGNGVGDSRDFQQGTSADCNGNGIPDECEIAAGTVPDDNGNGVPDPCETCPWDLDGDGATGITDLLDLLAQWGQDPGGPPDFDGDGSVGITDLLELLAHWGPCL